MSLIPEFEVGLWNAWIFILPLVIISIFGVRLFGKRVSGENASDTRMETLSFVCMHLIVIASYVYSVFLPLKLGTSWFYLGLLIYLSGMLTTIIAMLNFATTAVDKPVTKGVYTFSRNPMYIGESLINISISIACLSWLFFLVAVVVAILEHNIVVSEERFCLKKYGDAYREYVNRTPMRARARCGILSELRVESLRSLWSMNRFQGQIVLQSSSTFCRYRVPMAPKAYSKFVNEQI